jgi:flagellar basal-body rod protein FlgG
MIRGIYTAGTGMMNKSRVMDTIGNNIANAKTAGYKKDTVVAASFGEGLAYRLAGGGSEVIGAVNGGVAEGEMLTS